MKSGYQVIEKEKKNVFSKIVENIVENFVEIFVDFSVEKPGEKSCVITTRLRAQFADGK